MDYFCELNIPVKIIYFGRELIQLLSQLSQVNIYRRKATFDVDCLWCERKSGILSSPSPEPCPPRPNPNPKPKEIKNPSPIGTGGDTKITWATTLPHPTTPPITFNHEGVL